MFFWFVGHRIADAFVFRSAAIIAKVRVEFESIFSGVLRVVHFFAATNTANASVSIEITSARTDIIMDLSFGAGETHNKSPFMGYSPQFQM